MNQAMTVWFLIAGILGLVFGFQALVHRHGPQSRTHARGRHIIELGRDRDIFFIPGDKDDDDDDD